MATDQRDNVSLEADKYLIAAVTSVVWEFVDD